MLCCGETSDGKACRNKPMSQGSFCRHHLPQCPICLEDVGRNEMKTECGHYFHHDCLEEWLQCSMALNKLECPLCRATVGHQVLALRKEGYRSYIAPLESHRDIVIEGETIKLAFKFSDGWNWDLTLMSAALPVYTVDEKTKVDTFTRAHVVWTQGPPIELVPRRVLLLERADAALYSTLAPLGECTRKHWEIATRWGGELMMVLRPRFPASWNTMLADIFAQLLLDPRLRPVQSSMYQHMIVAAVHLILITQDDHDEAALWSIVRSYYPGSDAEEETALRVRSAANDLNWFDISPL